MLFGKSELSTYRYFIKSIGRLWLIPLVSINVLVPAVSSLLYRALGENAAMYIIDILFITLPVSAVWISVFVSELFFADKAKDIFFFYKIKKRFAVSLMLFLVTAINAVVVVLLHFKWIYDAFGFAVKIFCISVFFYGLAMLILYLSKTATMSVLMLILYSLLNEFVFSDFFLFYKNSDILTVQIFLLKYLPLLLLAVPLLFAAFKTLPINMKNSFGR